MMRKRKRRERKKRWEEMVRQKEKINRRDSKTEEILREEI